MDYSELTERELKEEKDAAIISINRERKRIQDVDKELDKRRARVVFSNGGKSEQADESA